jgi:hypothetical protein
MWQGLVFMVIIQTHTDLFGAEVVESFKLLMCHIWMHPVKKSALTSVPHHWLPWDNFHIMLDNVIMELIIWNILLHNHFVALMFRLHQFMLVMLAVLTVTCNIIALLSKHISTQVNVGAFFQGQKMELWISMCLVPFIQMFVKTRECACTYACGHTRVHMHTLNWYAQILWKDYQKNPVITLVCKMAANFGYLPGETLLQTVQISTVTNFYCALQCIRKMNQYGG